MCVEVHVRFGACNCVHTGGKTKCTARKQEEKRAARAWCFGSVPKTVCQTTKKPRVEPGDCGSCLHKHRAQQTRQRVPARVKVPARPIRPDQPGAAQWPSDSVGRPARAPYMPPRPPQPMVKQAARRPVVVRSAPVAPRPRQAAIVRPVSPVSVYYGDEPEPDDDFLAMLGRIGKVSPATRGKRPVSRTQRSLEDPVYEHPYLLGEGSDTKIKEDMTGYQAC
ncbi:hypothetical protein P8C59_004122 [Phyllachora maydis]|uniref:Uncharacterized protein n=1 Tax=Phyllachora maydis TaxID=1825666 RepID=A0AAD9MA26_9PEZI|nr:hypothetical protein P8C59_004122 [Phyllachora maydis]